MAAHLRRIFPRKCERGTCGKLASVILHNTRNAEIGAYCGKHGITALEAFKRSEGELR